MMGLQEHRKIQVTHSVKSKPLMNIHPVQCSPKRSGLWEL